MVDFNKKILNSDKFRLAALFFLKHELYCLYPSGTTEYIKYWELETERCLHGYTAEDGDWISGYNYFYLNYCPILRVVLELFIDRNGKPKTRIVRDRQFADFYDYDYYYYLYIQECEDTGKHGVVLKARGRGYEQPYSAKVLTPSGFVEMGSLLIGDYVMNPGGDKTIITDIVELSTTDVYEVELRDGRKTRCGKNHLWSTIRNCHGKVKVEVLTTEELSNVKLILGTPGKLSYPYLLPNINPLHLLNHKAIPIDPYVLGVLIGDGDISGDLVKFSTNDLFIRDEMSKLLPDYNLKPDSSNTYKYTLTSKITGVNQLNRDLKQLKLKVHSYNKFIPNCYKYTTVENRFALVLGLMDTDGSISNGASTFTSTSETLIDDLVFVLRSLGIRCRKSKKIEGRTNVKFPNGCTSNTKSLWCITITTLEQIFRLPRKATRIRTNRKYSYRGIGIKKITKLDYLELQRCIVVLNDNHLYITDDFIVTHNSFKGGSMLCRNYFLIPGSKSYAVASENEYLVKDGLLTKAFEFMDFIDKHTAWAKKRVIDRTMHKKSGVLITDDLGNKTELGYLSEIIGISLKNNPDRIRGKRGKLILWEEAGMFKDILQAWQIARPSVEADGNAFGTMIAYGCVCAGTKVWTADGNCINIEDLKKEDGIVGWNTYGAVLQSIENINPPSEKECVRITTTTGRTLECSTDHPLLWSTSGKTKRVPGNRSENERMKAWLWHNAGKCKVGELIGIINSIPIFGTKRMWEPRVVGWLIGDGSYGIGKTPVLSNCEDNINIYIEDNFNAATEKLYTTKDGKLYKETRIKGICPKLRKLGIYGQTKRDKRLPSNIHEYDYFTITELIGGLYDTDGYVSIAKNGMVRLILTQCQKEILTEVQNLLLHFGIHSSIRYINSNNRTHVSNGKTIIDRNGWFVLSIDDITSVAKFANCIPLTVPRKQSTLDLIAEFSKNHINKHNKYLVGVHAERIVSIEYIGLKPIYNLTASGNNNYIANGIVTHNTGGSEGEDFRGLRSLFYECKGYNVEELPNIWDENMDNTNCGFFVPLWSNMATIDENGNRIFMDKDGNSLRAKAIEYVLTERLIILDNATDNNAVDRYIAERPNLPQEACMELSGNIFPKKELLQQLAKIRTNKKLLSHKQVGDLNWVNGELLWQIKKHGDILKFPLGRDDDPTGSIVIWEHPTPNPQVGLYIAGCDPYDHDQAGTNSLGSTFIYKRFLNFESYYDIIVAEYTGRPATAEDYYENVRKLLIYYNARLLYENERKGIFPYFTLKHCDYLLLDLPDIINDIIGNSKVLRRKGIHMTKQIRIYGEGLIKEWLNEEFAPGCKNLTRIMSEPLLEELILTNGTMNVDRVIALIMVMIHRELLHNVKTKSVEETVRKQRVFDLPLFTDEWFAEGTQQTDNTPVFTFN